MKTMISRALIIILSVFIQHNILSQELKSINKQEEQTLAEEVSKNIAKILPDQLSRDSIPGAAVVVVDDQNSVWMKTYGHVDGKDSRPIDEKTIFSIQSMSKSFTALAVLMAVQDGLVDLDTPIKEYLPDFTVNSIYDAHPEEIITLRHLLSHRASFTHEAPFGSNFDDRNNFTRHVKSVYSTWLKYPIGYRLYYSNLGIDLAGYILQVRSGLSFELYVKEKVLVPLGMANTSLDMDVIEINKNRAIGHSRYRDYLPLRIPMISAGGVYSDIQDMAKYMQFHINKGVVNGQRILRIELMEQMHALQFPKSGQRSGYCLGLLKDPVSDTYSLYHSGGGYGFQSDMVMYPEKKLGIAILTNLANHNVSSWQFRELIVPILIKRFGASPIDEPAIEKMTKLEPSNLKVQAILGRYGGHDGKVIKEENNILGIQYSSGDFYPLTFHDNNGELVGMFGNFSGVRFLPPYNGRQGSMCMVNRRIGSNNFHFFDFNDSSTDPYGQNKSHWTQYIGNYELLGSGDPLDVESISVKNGYLYYSEIKCTEYEKGLFFTFEGEALDFRYYPPTYANIQLRKKKEK